jgi:choline-phosphate cytidylyltransferase
VLHRLEKSVHADEYRIVRDYDQYIDRQLKRGTSRKELNVSWLKKNELEVKRTMAEFRDSIKANWMTTGQELSRDFRQFWQSSRPASPARTPVHEREDGGLSPTGASATSPSAISRLSHLDIPRANERGSSEFAAGYSLGLIGGVRSWVSSLAAHAIRRSLTRDRWHEVGEI